MEFFIFLIKDRVDTWFKLRTTCFDIIINYHLSQKLKQIGDGEFNHLIIVLTTKKSKTKGYNLQAMDLYIELPTNEEY